MWFWNRSEVYHGFSLKEQSEVRESLRAHHIKYDFRIINLNSDRNKKGSYGINKKYETEYYIYVLKKEYQNALYVLGKQG